MILASFWTLSLSFVFILVSLLLIGLILLQKNRGSGLSGAFGGVGGHSAFGTKTGDFLTWLTVGLTGVFMLLAIIGNFAFEPAKPQPVVPVAPAPTPAPMAESPAPTPTPVPVSTTPPPVTPAPTPAPLTPVPAPSTPPAGTSTGSPASSTPPVPSGGAPSTP